MKLYKATVTKSGKVYRKYKNGIKYYGHIRVCIVCREPAFFPYGHSSRKTAIYCSKVCSLVGRNGTYGRRINSSGYVLIYSPKHPFHNRVNCVVDHRLVLERKLGRYLRRSEIVHHKNGIKTDNKVSNLLLLTPSQHSRLHYHADGRPIKHR